MLRILNKKIIFILTVTLSLVFISTIYLLYNETSNTETIQQQNKPTSPLSTDWRKYTQDSADELYVTFRSSYMTDNEKVIEAYSGPLEAKIKQLHDAEIVRYLTIPETNDCLFESSAENQEQCFFQLANYEIAVSKHTESDYDTYYQRCQETYPKHSEDSVLMSSCALAYFTNLDRCDAFFAAGVLDYDWCIFARNDFNQNYFTAKLQTLISDIEEANKSISETDTAQQVHAGALELPELLRQYDVGYREQRRRECELASWENKTSSMGRSWVEACANNLLGDYENALNKVREQYFSTYPLNNESATTSQQDYDSCPNEDTFDRFWNSWSYEYLSNNPNVHTDIQMSDWNALMVQNNCGEEWFDPLADLIEQQAASATPVYWEYDAN